MTDVYSADPFRNAGSVSTHDPFTQPGAAGERHYVNFNVDVGLAPTLARLQNYKRNQNVVFTLDPQIGKESFLSQQMTVSLSVDTQIQKRAHTTLAGSLPLIPEITASQFRQILFDAIITLEATLTQAYTRKFLITLEGVIEFIGDLVAEFIAGPIEEPPTGGGPGGRVYRRKPPRRRREREKRPLEAQAERILTSSNLPNYYPVGAKKAYNNMQQFYGTLDGRRIFIKKALEQGRGQTLREKIADVYATGTTVDQRKKMKTQVTMRGGGGPTVKIMSNRGTRKG